MDGNVINSAAEHELELEKARQHVREAEDRLARQRQIVDARELCRRQPG